MGTNLADEPPILRPRTAALDVPTGGVPVEKPKPVSLVDALAAHKAAPTPETADAVLTAAGPVMRRAVRAYAGADSPMVRGHAKRLVLDAATRYDPDRGTKPETYLLGHLQSLRRYGAALAAPIRLGDQLRGDTVIVDRHASELRDELGREPSDGELSDRLGIPVSRVARARGVPATFVESAAPEGLVGATPAASGAARKAWLEHLYHDLDPISQVVLERTAGLNGHPVQSTTQIAKLLGLTPGAISQRKAKIETRLNEYSRLLGSR